MIKKIILTLGALLVGCDLGERVEVPELESFDLRRYTGMWREYARTDNRFQKGLEQVTARYWIMPNGKLRVVNRGFSPQKGEWKQSVANAKVQKDRNAYLKVYFFLLFGGDYHVAYVDDDYNIAVVSGGTTEFLWFLTRSSKVTPSQHQKMIEVATDMGYDTTKLLFPKMKL